MSVEPSTILIFHFTVGALSALYYLWNGWRTKVFYLPAMVIPALFITALGPVTPLSKLFRKIGMLVEENKRRAEDEDPEEEEWYRAIK